MPVILLSALKGMENTGIRGCYRRDLACTRLSDLHGVVGCQFGHSKGTGGAWIAGWQFL